MQWSGQQ
jgi:hypothetical protein